MDVETEAQVDWVVSLPQKGHGKNRILSFCGRKSTENGFVGNPDASEARGINVLLRDMEIVTEI